jgi:ATP-binding cassette subfamily B protein
VLDKVSFTVESGATIAIVGGSGSGKSSIVRLLTRLVEPDSGQILMDGVPLSELPIQMVRRAIAVVPQDAVLFDESIAYNIAFGREDVSQRDIEEAARVAHLHAFISGLPEKYDTKIGERGVRLSGGERQRLSIARAALRRPLVYVFDEATSSLDSATEQQILDNVREISLKSTTVVIAHRLSTIVHADQILVLENGQVCEIGSHRSLLARGGRYASLWAAQERGYAVA